MNEPNISRVRYPHLGNGGGVTLSVWNLAKSDIDALVSRIPDSFLFDGEISTPLCDLICSLSNAPRMIEFDCEAKTIHSRTDTGFIVMPPKRIEVIRAVRLVFVTDADAVAFRLANAEIFGQ